MDEREEGHITAACSHRLPRIQGGLNKDEVVQWIVTTLNSGQRFILTNPEERLGSWYQGFWKEKDKDEIQTLVGGDLIHSRVLENRFSKVMRTEVKVV